MKSAACAVSAEKRKPHDGVDSDRRPVDHRGGDEAGEQFCAHGLAAAELGGEEDGVRFQTVLTREDAADEEDDDEEKKHYQRWCVINQRFPAVVVLVVEGRLHGFVLVDEKVCLSRREADIRTRQPFFEILHTQVVKLAGLVGRQGVEAIIIVLIESAIGLGNEAANGGVALGVMVGGVLALNVGGIVVLGGDDPLIFLGGTQERGFVDRSGPFVFECAQFSCGSGASVAVAVFLGVGNLQHGAVADHSQPDCEHKQRDFAASTAEDLFQFIEEHTAHLLLRRNDRGTHLQELVLPVQRPALDAPMRQCAAPHHRCWI